VGGKGGDGGKEGEMTQSLYAHMNKVKILKKEEFIIQNHCWTCKGIQ
jgi:hypothetical protein